MHQSKLDVVGTNNQTKFGLLLLAEHFYKKSFNLNPLSPTFPLGKFTLKLNMRFALNISPISLKKYKKKYRKLPPWESESKRWDALCIDQTS